MCCVVVVASAIGNVLSGFKTLQIEECLHPFSTGIGSSTRDQDSESYTIKVSLTCTYYLMANSHICLACIVTVVEVHSLAMVFESKAMKSLNTVGSETTFWSDILMRLLGHFVEET